MNYKDKLTNLCRKVTRKVKRVWKQWGIVDTCLATLFFLGVVFPISLTIFLRCEEIKAEKKPYTPSIQEWQYKGHDFVRFDGKETFHSPECKKCFDRFD